MNGLLDYFREKYNIKLGIDDVRMLNPLVLAYIGDTVYDLFVRAYLVATHRSTVHQLNNKAIEYVKASAQCSTLHKIENMLTDDEKDIVRRGRNVKSATIPKNADVGEYRWATGLEALVGYLYLTGEKERLFDIIGIIIDAKGE